MRRRSGVAGESSSNQPWCPASSLAAYTASCTFSACMVRQTIKGAISHGADAALCRRSKSANEVRLSVLGT